MLGDRCSVKYGSHCQNSKLGRKLLPTFKQTPQQRGNFSRCRSWMWKHVRTAPMRCYKASITQISNSGPWPNLIRSVIIFGPRDDTKCLLELACQQTAHAPLILQIPECSAGALVLPSGPTSAPSSVDIISDLMLPVASGHLSQKWPNKWWKTGSFLNRWKAEYLFTKNTYYYSLVLLSEIHKVIKEKHLSYISTHFQCIPSASLHYVNRRINNDKPISICFLFVLHRRNYTGRLFFDNL